MTVAMVILGWKSEGLRCPDHEVNCATSTGEHFPVSLIQMPNGTGKTTTLELLRSALSGSSDNSSWSARKVKEFQKRDSSSQKGLFEVRLLLSGRQCTISMNFDFDQGAVTCYTTLGEGQKRGFRTPPEFRRIMNEKFVNFFIFDGELAQHLLDEKHPDARLVVEGLFRLNLFEEMSGKVLNHWKRISKEAGAKSKAELVRKRNDLNAIEEQLKKCRDEEKKLKSKMANLKEQRDQKQAHYESELQKGDSRSKALVEAEKEHADAKNNVQRNAERTLELMRSPHAIHSSLARSMMQLKDGLDKARLPESAAREFFEDIAKEKECICGRAIDKKIADTIRKRSTSYLGNDDVILLNSMKTLIHEEVGSSLDKKSGDLKSQLGCLEAKMDEERRLDSNVKALSLEVMKSNPVARDVINQVEKLNIEIDRIEQELKKFGNSNVGGDVKHICGIEVLKEMKRVEEISIGKMTKTLKERDKRDTLDGILRTAHVKARDAILSEIQISSNELITELMPNNDILIKEVRENLILEGRDGGSVGETLAVAYSFLGTMFNGSDYKLPFVVDSPAGSIDLEIRPKIAKFIPVLTSQFIAFMISSERQKFVEPLKEASLKQVQFITLFNRNVENMKVLAYKFGNFEETIDGLNVSGEEFFELFQVEEKEM